MTVSPPGWIEMSAIRRRAPADARACLVHKEILSGEGIGGIGDVGESAAVCR
jgi:hypothetical protein